jgi:hypothetical protein
MIINESRSTFEHHHRRDAMTLSNRFLKWAGATFAGALAATSALAADIDFGKVGEPVKLVVGYQPYYTESWSGVIMRSKKFYEKYLPRARRSISRSACRARSS